VAHLAEHRRAVNRIAVAHNGAFFVTASNDETCKIWDSRRLEKDTSFRSKLTYASQVDRPTLYSPNALLPLSLQCANGRIQAVRWCGLFLLAGTKDGKLCGQGGKILAVTACEESQSIASASSNGSVHVWRVEYTTRSGGAPDRYTSIIGEPAPPTAEHCLAKCCCTM
jgi:phosphoinositide-3-kinase regulatory subunit 4